MAKLFGTDGIRGVVNMNLSGELAYRVGQAAAVCLKESPDKKPLVLIGMDTRISSQMIENALTAGLCSCGADVVKLGVVPTPAVAYLTVQQGADAGIVISASHNPFEHNGIKFFSAEGFKLSDEMEEKMEALILQEEPLCTVTHDALGTVTDAGELKQKYLDHIASTVGSLSGLKIAVDCANGAASATAKDLFARFDLDVTYLCDAPDGVNINRDCGSTSLWNLADIVRQGGFDLGIAFDGDADRCLAVDESGRYVDGDQIMSICAMEMAREERLSGGGFVATVMSNIGLHKFADAHGLKLLCASVGDRNVLELMQKENMRLGGEQSGHIIFLDHMTTGDGQLAALQFLDIICRTGKKVSELASLVTRYPQVLINVPGPADNAAKRMLLENDILLEAVAEGERQLNGDGRILVRASGTEALIRVMVEAGTSELAENTARAIASTVQTLQK